MNRVSYFSLELSRVMEIRHLSDADVSRKSGLSPSQVSRLRTGKQKRITQPTFKKVALAVSSDLKVHASLLVAALRDAAEKLPGYVHVNLNTSDGESPLLVKLKNLPPSLEAAFSTLLKKCEEDPRWVSIVVTVADTLAGS